MTFCENIKKLISFLLILCMILSILPCQVLAADVVDRFSVMEAASFPEGTIGCEGDDIPRTAPYETVAGAIDQGQPVEMYDVPYATSELAGETVRYSVLVLDTSDSSSFEDNGRIFYTADTAIDYVKASAKKFVSDVQKADGINYVAVVEYKSTASNIVSGFTTDYDALNQTIDGLYSSGETRSVAYGLQKVNSLLDTITDPTAIKNVVLFTTGMTNEGPYSYSGRYDEDTVASGWRRMDTQVRLYAYSNSAIEEAEKLKSKATLYTVGLFQVMEDMPQTGRDVVEFFKLFAKDTATSDDYFYDVSDPSQLEFVFGDIAEDIINRKRTGTFMFPSDDEESKKNPEKKKDYAATYYYDDNYFSTDASTYNPSLATMSLCFALSAFGSNLDGTTNYENKARNAKALLDAVGFKDVETNNFFTVKPSEDSMGVIIGHKDIMVEGTPYTLIALATRGGGYEAEWAGNFTIGASGQHQGFETAKKEAHRFLEEYINAYKGDFQDNVKIWMAGYSRAGATANMLAGQLDDDKYIADINLTKEDIYAYCFEPPMGALSSDVLPISNYDNIHNIVNPSDLVPKVAPRGWSFARYGVDEPVIPTRLISSNQEDYNAMLEKFKALNTAGSNESLTNGGKKHIVDTFQAKKIDVGVDIDWGGHWEKRTGILGIPYYVFVNDTTIDAHLISNDGKDMSAFLDSLILSLAAGIGDRENYTQKLQASMRLVMAETLGGGYESYKWDKVPDILYEKLQDHLLDLAYQLVVNGVSGVEGLVTKYLIDSIKEAGIDLEAYTSIPGALREALQSLVRTIVASILVSGGNDLITLAYNAGKLFFAHYPELCLAWLQMQDVNYTPDGHQLFVINAYRIVRINCPVDVDVRDETGVLVAQFVDDVPQDTGSTIISSYTADGEKVIYLPADQDYDITIVATDDGELSYSVSEFSYDTFNYTRLVNYNNVEITDGEVLEASVDRFSPEETTNTASGSARDYTLASNKQGELTATVDIAGEDAEDALFSVSVGTNNADSGTVIGGGAYTMDSFAQVSAIPYDNCEFEGWYEDDTLVSADTVYRFAVQDNTHLIAKFSGTRPTPENSPDSFTLLTMNAGSGGSITKGATGYYTPGTEVTVTAAANTGYTFSGWTSSSSNVVFADASIATTTFVVPEAGDEIIISATFKSTKSSNSGGGGTVTTNNPSYQIIIPTTSNGTVTVTPTSAKSGDMITITTKPDNGYAIGSVTVTDSSGKSVSFTDNGAGTYTFTMPSSQVTVNATFVAIIDTPWDNPFTDVSESDWFYDDVAYVVQNGLMTGVGNGQFNPNGTTTRGMIMTILARLDGLDTSGGSPWYQPGMEWAVQAGVSDGTSPEADITREQFVTMLWRYAGKPAATGSLSAYSDTANVNDWARDAMAWAIENGIIYGTDGNKLDPQGSALRSQAAAMFARFCKNI